MSRIRLNLEGLEDRTLPSSAQIVAAFYADFLHRSPAPAEAQGYIDFLDSGGSPATVASMFLNSDERINLETTLDYETLLGRDPSPGELQGWLTARHGGMTARQEEANFLASDEFFAREGGTTQGWLIGVYNDALGRLPDADGLNGFLPLPSQTAQQRLLTASDIVFSTEGNMRLVAQTYQELLNRPPDSGGLNAWTSALAGGMSDVRMTSLIAGSPEFAALASSGATAVTTGNPLITLNLNPLNINLLGLHIQTDQIQVVISAQPGAGELLGNVLTDASNLLNLPGVSGALNNVLGSVVTLLNSTSLNVAGILPGTLDSAASAVTPVLDLFVAPVHLNLLGALVDTSPIHLTITAESGPSANFLLGNVVSDLANLFNPPLPSTLTIGTINTALQNLLNELNAQIPGIGAAPTTTPPTTLGTDQVLQLTVPPIDVNLLGLILKTTQIQVNVNAITGNADLLGNVLTTLLNTLGATPADLSALSTNLNSLLAKVVGVLNASSLTLPSGVVSSLSSVLQTLALPNLVNASGTATTPILNLAIASTDGTTPPVNVNLLGLQITTSDIQAQLLAQTGDGNILGNLLYNVANLLNPGGATSLLGLLGALAL